MKHLFKKTILALLIFASLSQYISANYFDNTAIRISHNANEQIGNYQNMNCDSDCADACERCDVDCQSHNHCMGGNNKIIPQFLIKFAYLQNDQFLLYADKYQKDIQDPDPPPPKGKNLI